MIIKRLKIEIRGIVGELEKYWGGILLLRPSVPSKSHFFQTDK